MQKNVHLSAVRIYFGRTLFRKNNVSHRKGAPVLNVFCFLVPSLPMGCFFCLGRNIFPIGKEGTGNREATRIVVGNSLSMEKSCQQAASKEPASRQQTSNSKQPASSQPASSQPASSKPAASKQAKNKQQASSK